MLIFQNLKFCTEVRFFESLQTTAVGNRKPLELLSRGVACILVDPSNIY